MSTMQDTLNTPMDTTLRKFEEFYDEERGDAATKITALEQRLVALVDALKEAGDVIESYHLTTGIDLGDASMMPFYDQTIMKIDLALGSELTT
jgi:hypothetical protein